MIETFYKDIFVEIMRQLKLSSKEREGVIDFHYDYNENHVGVIDFTLILHLGESAVRIKKTMYLDPNMTTIQCEDNFFKGQIKRLIKRGIIGMVEDAVKAPRPTT